MKRETDIRVENHGTVFQFFVLTERADKWVNERVSLEPYQWLGKASFVVEHGYAQDLVAGMQREGLTVE